MKTTNHFGEFRIYLQDELTRRCNKNSSYSLRSFAKSLSIAPSALSSILNGKRPLTAKTTMRLGLTLGMKMDELNKKYLLPNNRPQAVRYRTLVEDCFATISEWYYLPMIQLSKVRGFKGDARYISKALGITRSQANIAIERLQRLGLIEIREDGSWKLMDDGHSTNIKSDFTNEAKRNLQIQLLERAIEAIRSEPISRRDHTGMAMAVNSKDIPVAKDLIKKFRRELAHTLENQTEKDEVYQLSIAFFPITKPITKTVRGEE